MWKQIKTYTAAWVGRTFSVDFYQNLDLEPGVYSRAGAGYDVVTPLSTCTSGVHHHHHHWTPEPANEMVKLPTSAGSLCRGDTSTSLHHLPWPASQSSGRARLSEAVWRELAVNYCHVVPVVTTMCLLSSPLLSVLNNINSLFQIPVMSAACSDGPNSALVSTVCLPDLHVPGSGHWSVTNSNLIVNHL